MLLRRAPHNERERGQNAGRNRGQGSFQKTEGVREHELLSFRDEGLDFFAIGDTHVAGDLSFTLKDNQRGLFHDLVLLFKFRGCIVIHYESDHGFETLFF